MLLGTLGAGMVCCAAYKAWSMRPKAYLKNMTRLYFEHCDCEVKIQSLSRIENGYSMTVLLPMGLTVQKFDSHVAGLELATGSTIIAKHLYGRVCELRFGYAPFYEKMSYESERFGSGLAVPLYTPFGLKWIDFRDESCCHLLVGGATRMGKSVFLRLLTTHLLRSTGGKVKFYLLDNKITDLWMFWNIPQCTIAETITEARVFLQDVVAESERRKELLKSKKNVVDLKSYREKYPDDPVDPMFVVIDEYARFAEDDDLQELVTYIAETAGYVDVHLIVASQRPDASTVLKPRIRANLLTRVAFTTADEKNSEIILGINDAAHLGRIKGRAILFDGFPMKAQVPYISEEQAKNLLVSFYVEKEDDDNYDDERQDDPEIPEALPRFVTGSTREFGV